MDEPEGVVFHGRVCALRLKKKIDGCWVRSGLGLCLPPFPMLLLLLCPFQLDPTVELGL